MAAAETKLSASPKNLYPIACLKHTSTEPSPDSSESPRESERCLRGEGAYGSGHLELGSALYTLCGQSFGAKQHHMLGIHTQRAMVVLMLVSIPVAIIWAYTGLLLIAFGQDPEISEEAGLYATWLIPTIFPYALLQCLVKFLQTQNIVFPMMLTSGVATLLHVLVCWILVFKSGLGNKGAALANFISYWINVLLLALYVKLSPACKKTWTGFSRDALSDIPNFIRLAIPSACMVCQLGSLEI